MLEKAEVNMDSSSSSYQDERTRILRLVEDGALSAAEAISLLENLGTGRRSPAAPPSPGGFPSPVAPPFMDESGYSSPPGQASATGAPRWFRVRVTDCPAGAARCL
jgi:hypothetical protein